MEETVIVWRRYPFSVFIGEQLVRMGKERSCVERETVQGEVRKEGVITVEIHHE